MRPLSRPAFGRGSQFGFPNAAWASPRILTVSRRTRRGGTDPSIRASHERTSLSLECRLVDLVVAQVVLAEREVHAVTRDGAAAYALARQPVVRLHRRV